jgi:hypothetical protein
MRAIEFDFGCQYKQGCSLMLFANNRLKNAEQKKKTCKYKILSAKKTFFA